MPPEKKEQGHPASDLSPAPPLGELFAPESLAVLGVWVANTIFERKGQPSVTKAEQDRLEKALKRVVERRTPEFIRKYDDFVSLGLEVVAIFAKRTSVMRPDERTHHPGSGSDGDGKDVLSEATHAK